ncbi:PilW family protein [Zobellella maritima]|uniref:PilW family protein n=1 Tax=Zobellella maritima TaxID=2059725 RepID=UPI000E3030D1|nr:type IV pilin [Zobellella maritima]
MLSRNKGAGFSVVEMLVSLVAGLVVLAGGISLFTTVVVSGNTTLMLSRLNQDMQAVGDIISRDLQRAGYHPSAAEDMAQGTPPSSAKSTKYVFSVADDLYVASGASAAHCIRIKYWESETSPATPVVRVYGYDAANKVLKVTTNYNEPTSAALSSGDCSSGSKLVSDDEVLIDGLSFELVSGSSATGMRAIEVDITASHARKPALSMSLQRQVKLRNDGY